MAEPPRLRIRCTEQVKNRYAEAASAFGMTYGEFAVNAAKFILANRKDFRRFVYEEEEGYKE